MPGMHSVMYNTNSVIKSLSPIVWFDAADASTVTTNNAKAVSGWADKSGNGYNLVQTTASKKPIYANLAKNTKNCIFFDGLSTNLQTSSNFDRLSGSANHHFFMLVNHSSTTLNGNPKMISFGTDAVNSGCGFGIIAGPSFFGSYYNNDVSVGNPAPGSWYIVEWTYTASTTYNSIFVYTAVNTTLSTIVLTTPAVINANPLFIGCGLSNAEFWQGYAGEIIMFDKVLGSTDSASVVTYLNNKWKVF